MTLTEQMTRLAQQAKAASRELARLPFGFTIRKPVALRRSLAAHAHALLARIFHASITVWVEGPL